MRALVNYESLAGLRQIAVAIGYLQPLIFEQEVMMHRCPHFGLFGALKVLIYQAHLHPQP